MRDESEQQSRVALHGFFIFSCAKCAVQLGAWPPNMQPAVLRTRTTACATTSALRTVRDSGGSRQAKLKGRSYGRTHQNLFLVAGSSRTRPSKWQVFSHHSSTHIALAPARTFLSPSSHPRPDPSELVALSSVSLWTTYPDTLRCASSRGVQTCRMVESPASHRSIAREFLLFLCFAAMFSLC